MVNGARIRLVRELKGLTQGGLANYVGVAQSAIAQVESGTSTISEELAGKIAFKTGFPLSFFKQDDVTDFPLGSLLFRAHSSLRASERAEAHRYGQIIFEVVERMRSQLNDIPLRLPRLEDDPIRAANITRSHFGLSPDTPIANLVNVVEKAGVFVFALPISLDGFDAFSLWAGSDPIRPVIVLDSSKASDRLRMNVAHEIGHLVQHQAVKGNLRNAEKAANRFAAELLLPEEAMRQEIVVPVTVTGITKLKPKWKVSIQALIVRAHEIGIISDRQYRYLFEQVSARGWRKHEPLPLPAERPRAVRKMAELLYGNPIDLKRFASDAHISIQFAREMIEAHATHPNAPTIQISEPANKRPIPIFTETAKIGSR